jgi:hypothetical protein
MDAPMYIGVEQFQLAPHELWYSNHSKAVVPSVESRVIKLMHKVRLHCGIGPIDGVL